MIVTMEINPNSRKQNNQNINNASSVLKILLKNNKEVQISDAMLKEYAKKFANLSSLIGQSNLAEEMEDEIYETLKKIFLKQSKKRPKPS